MMNQERKIKIFVSATTKDLKSYRNVVANWARSQEFDVVVQDAFSVQSDYGTIVQMLRDKIDPCDAVIHLAGLFYGFEPTNRPDGEARRSYTQLEYELGKELRRQVFRFIVRDDYQPDAEFSQTDEQAELQQRHRQRLMHGNEAWSPTSRTTGNELYYEFSNQDELRRLLDNIHIKPTLVKPQNLPLVGSLFKGRDEFIEQLRAVLVKKPTHIAAVTARHAIHGLGGVGKTRVAVEYAKRFSHEYSALLFITADSPVNLQRNLANLCGALVLNLPEKDAREQEIQVAAALRWLREHSGWFLIIDNVDSPEAATEVETLLQQLDTGHVVVTSRLSQWGGAVEELSLDVISETAAKEFLLERTQGKRKPTSSDDADATALAMDLGRLPLALEQSGAFIVKHRGSFQEYRERWKKQETKVLEWHDLRSMKYPASVAATWQTSFDLLGDDGQGLLNVLCWLAPDPIPLTMIEKLSAAEDESEIDIETGIADLAEYSLLKWAGNEIESVEVHRLVQEITRYRMPESARVAWLRRALWMVNDFVPDEPACDDVRSWPTIYIPGQNHIAAIIQLADKLCGEVVVPAAVRTEIVDSITPLMAGLAGYFHARASYAEAEVLMRRELALVEQSYGTEQPNIASRLSNLAALLLNTNRMLEAEPLMRRALAIDEKAYGTEHPDLSIVLNNLAFLLQATNRLSEAEPLMRRVLAIDERSYGTEHPNVARDLNNLASLLQATNRLSEAELLMTRVVTIFEKSCGERHPNVATALNNVAQLLQATNRLTEAEALMRRALAIDEHAYGTLHPRVATRLNNLALLLKATNRLSECEPLIRRALAIDEQSYGTGHPSVARDLSNLSELLRATHRLSGAEPLIRRALAIDEQSYGTEHPNVAIRLNNLAALLQDSNRMSEAEPLMRRSLAINQRSYGKDHPNVARCLNNLARMLQATQRLSEAEPLMRRALAIFAKGLGKRHPSTIAVQLNLDVLLEEMKFTLPIGPVRKRKCRKR